MWWLVPYICTQDAGFGVGLEPLLRTCVRSPYLFYLSGATNDSAVLIGWEEADLQFVSRGEVAVVNVDLCNVDLLFCFRKRLLQLRLPESEVSWVRDVLRVVKIGPTTAA
jgi:hypothetical protein